jgi:hypothetical protein
MACDEQCVQRGAFTFRQLPERQVAGLGGPGHPLRDCIFCWNKDDQRQFAAVYPDRGRRRLVVFECLRQGRDDRIGVVSQQLLPLLVECRLRLRCLHLCLALQRGVLRGRCRGSVLLRRSALRALEQANPLEGSVLVPGVDLALIGQDGGGATGRWAGGKSCRCPLSISRKMATSRCASSAFCAAAA